MTRITYRTTEENPVGFVDGLLRFFPEAVPRAKL